jgi:hypothetical protein
MRPRNLLVAAAVLLALSGAVWWAQKHPSSGSTSTTPTATVKLLDVPASSISQVSVAKKGNPAVVLAKQADKWGITAPQSYPADQSTVETLLGATSPLNAENLVEAKPSDPSQFGLAAPSLVVEMHEKGGKTDKISFGDDVPGESTVYASIGSDPKVYAVSSSVKSSFDKSVNDLRDKRLLTFDPQKLTQVQLGSAKTDVVFGKNSGGEWQMVKPAGMRADTSQVDDLVRKLGDARMDFSASPEDQKKAKDAMATGQLAGGVRITDASGTQTLTVKKVKDDYYGKSSVADSSYKINADLGKDLEKSVDDFRNKKLFDFAFADPNKLTLQAGGDTKAFLRQGTDWKLNGKTMDPGTVQSVIDKLRDLASTRFVTSGFGDVADSFTVESNDGKRTERVEIAKAPTGYFARRSNEPTIYQLDAKSVDDILEGIKAIKPAAAPKK